MSKYDNILNFQDCQAGRKEFWRLRSKFGKKSERYRRENRLGPEFKLAQRIVEESRPTSPWEWWQISTQKDMADRFSMPPRTFERYLKKLREQGVIIATNRVSSGVVPGTKEGAEYPVYTVNYLLVEEVLNPMIWPSGPFPERMIQSAETMSWNRQSGGPVHTEEKPEWRSQNAQIPATEGVLFNCQPSHNTNTTSSTSTGSSTRTDESFYRVERLRRARQVKTMGRMNRWDPSEDWEVPSVGKDPDRAESSRHQTKKSASPVLEIVSHFQREWFRVASKHMGWPTEPWGSGKRGSMLGYVKQTLLPRYDNDVEYIKQLITLYCDSGMFDERLKYSPRSQFSNRLDALQKDALRAGILSKNEQLVKLTADIQLEQRRAENQRMADLRAEEAAAAAEKERLRPKMISGRDAEELWDTLD
jgi:DNA-binding transcriptional ArsR family regulator